MKLSQMQRKRTEKVMIFGGPKSGKTKVIGDLALEGYKLKIIDIEESYKTLFQLPVSAQDNIEVFAIPDMPTSPLGARFLVNFVKNGGRSYICEEHMQVNCAACRQKEKFIDLDYRNWEEDSILVLESGNQLQRSVMSDILGLQRLEKKPEWDDYARQGAVMEMILGYLQAMPISVIVTSHEVQAEFENKTKKIVPVCGTSTYSANGAKFFDHVIYTAVEGKNYRAYSSNKILNTIAASRYGIDLSELPEPSLLPIFRYTSPTDNGERKAISASAEKAAAVLNSVTSEANKPTGILGKGAALSASAILAAKAAGKS